ncbi:hypothetical protein KUTeg_017286 [Tegillarca granosa]|uniref:Uncharacterized protein n=1 Tax=Tegillarca granosa TaxID=220873 RepID=A0ABQ9EIT4_TEGGR|nr:hypothetical protein KUTeg_017286 [Tegillarca granosa]
MFISDGHARFSAKAPDTITSWIASAFAINKDSGLGISSSSAKLNVFRSFFISLNLPYAVVRNEEVVIQVNIFNYLSQDMNVLVTLEKNTDFKNIIVKDSSGKQLHTTPQTVKIKGGEAASVYFPIVPVKIGKIDLSVKAQSSAAADGVKRKLLVEPEGVAKDYNVPVIIDLTKNNSFERLINITFPSSVVAGSERVRITAIGDFMGPTITGLDSLLRMPTGCGEQTMIGFAPDVFVSNYLKASGQLEDSVKNKAIGFMQKGYQRELTFQHTDGSFSAFGESDYSGSMLTAFVVKTFHQAKKHVLIDDSTILKALDWIMYRQTPDGSFYEPGNVVHSQLKGGSGTGIGLTAFVTIALVENKDLYGAIVSRLQTAINKAQSYLESKLLTIKDTYTLAITSYALALTGSNSSKIAYNDLESAAIFVDGTKHWEVNQDNSNLYWKPPEQQATAIDIEATSYALLYHAHNKDYTSELGFLGGGENSLTGLNMSININGDTIKHQFSLGKQNALVLQSVEPKPAPSFVNISATGSGFGLVEVSVFFNVEQELKQPRFSMNVTLLEEKLNRLTLRTCTRYLMTGASGMTVLELGIPTGFELDSESVIEVSTLKRTETVDRKVIFYFDKITQTETCLTLSVTRTDLVAKSQPVPVRVYDYYSPELQQQLAVIRRLYLKNINVKLSIFRFRLIKVTVAEIRSVEYEKAM